MSPRGSAPFFLSLQLYRGCTEKESGWASGSVTYSSGAFKNLSEQPQSMPAGWKPQSQPGPVCVVTSCTPKVESRSCAFRKYSIMQDLSRRSWSQCATSMTVGSGCPFEATEVTNLTKPRRSLRENQFLSVSCSHTKVAVWRPNSVSENLLSEPADKEFPHLC